MTRSEGFEYVLAQQPRRHAITRRELLRRMGIGAAGLSSSALLAACGIQGQAENGGNGADDALTTTKEQGELSFANWPAYIDKAGKKYPTIEQFEAETGIDVNYQTVINDNLTFYATIREPLSNNQAVEWDLIVVTDWLVKKMADLGQLEQLDHSLLKTFDEHAGEIYKDPVYDPQNMHSIPWQAGITGIAYNMAITDREITSSNELFDPKWENQVGMLTEMRDTMNLVLLNLGVDPQEANEDDARAAQQRLLEQRDAGIVRNYYGNDYVQPLEQGDLALCMAWSGDVIGSELTNPDIRFIVPEEGGIHFVDNMCIPQNAAHPIDAHMMMDFVYQPEIAAQMTAWINYISPVPEAQQLLLQADDAFARKVARSPLAFPTPEMEARVHSYKPLGPEEEQVWNELFDAVLEG